MRFQLRIWIVGLVATSMLFSACREGNGGGYFGPFSSRDQNWGEPSAAVPDWAAQANIYEVNTRQYTPEGTFKAFATHLPRLKEMGVDILWFMPIYPISVTNRKGSLGSYYAISDYRAINPEHGTLADFKQLVDTIHQMGMRVIIDWVPNHTGWDHHWITEHPDWYTQDKDGKIVDPIDPKTGKSWGWTDVADLNYDNLDMRAAMIADMQFWLDSVGIDGFRCDVASDVPDEFWGEAVTQLRKSKADVFMLAEAEHPPHRNEEFFAMSYGWSFHQLLNQVAKGDAGPQEIKDWLEQDRDKYSKGYNMHFITNHDENTWNGSEFERMGPAVDAMAVLAFTFDGMPLIYSGQESALNKRLRFFDKDTIPWGDYSKAAFYRTLLKLKHDKPVLANGPAGASPVFLDLGAEKVLAYYRQKGAEMVMVLINLSNEPVTLSWDQKDLAGAYFDIFEQKPRELNMGSALQLGAWGYLVLTL